MIRRSPAITGTMPSPGRRTSSTHGKVTERGPLSIGQRTLTGWVSLVVFAAALAMTQLLKWNPLVVLAVSTLLGTGAWVLGWV
jgi:hypothetical protein